MQNSVRLAINLVLYKAPFLKGDNAPRFAEHEHEYDSCSDASGRTVLALVLGIVVVVVVENQRKKRIDYD